jgi:hypothetical protein
MFNNTEKLDILLENLTENDLKVLYAHPLLDNYDLLPKVILKSLIRKNF